MEKFISQIAHDIEAKSKVTSDEARKFAVTFVKRRIAELVGAPAPKQRGFEDTSIYKNPIVQQQIANFENLFSGEDSSIRQQSLELLEFISSNLLKIAKSTDNHGEAHNVETLDAQMKGNTGGSNIINEKQNTPVVTPKNRRQPNMLFRMTSIVNPTDMLWYPYED